MHVICLFSLIKSLSVMQGGGLKDGDHQGNALPQYSILPEKGHFGRFLLVNQLYFSLLIICTRHFR